MQGKDHVLGLWAWSSTASNSGGGRDNPNNVSGPFRRNIMKNANQTDNPQPQTPAVASPAVASPAADLLQENLSAQAMQAVMASLEGVQKLMAQASSQAAADDASDRMKVLEACITDGHKAVKKTVKDNERLNVVHKAVVQEVANLSRASLCPTAAGLRYVLETPVVGDFATAVGVFGAASGAVLGGLKLYDLILK